MKTLLAIDRLLIMVFLIIFMQSEQDKADAQQPQKPGAAPVMKVTNQNTGDLSMRLDVLAVDIRIVGKIAVTTLDMTFMNPNDRVLEGEFTFPLENGHTVSRFALDIEGKLREGVVVEKEKGRVAFEAIARKKVDPGLLEMTEGNNFRARVFPLPAHGTRRIVIAYDQELTPADNGETYRLPLGIKEPVRKFSVHAEVLKNKVRTDSDNQFSNLNFREKDNSYIADLEEQNFIPDHTIALRFPSTEEPAVFTARRDAVTSWFYLNIKPDFEMKKKALPAKVALLWDNSGSAVNRDITKELQLLDLYFKKAGNLTVELVPFNIKTEKSRFFEIISGNWDSLRLTLGNLIYDGGTNYGQLDFRRYRADEILFVTDGLSSFGSGEIVTGNVPVYSINSSRVANHSFLSGISGRTSGTYVDLSSIGIIDALEKLVNFNFRYISTVIEEGNTVDIYPSSDSRGNSTFSMAGIMIGEKAVININFGYSPSETHTVRIALNAENTADPGILQRIWAKKKIEDLSLDEEKNEKLITAAGKEFGIVTRNTSLIVLETLEDYLRFEIVPPVELQAEYYDRLNIASGIKNEAINNHLNRVMRGSQQQTEWWLSVFPLKEMPVVYHAPEVVGEAISDTVAFVEEPVMVEMDAVITEDSEVPPPPPPPAANSDRRALQLEVSAEAELGYLHADVNYEGGAPAMRNTDNAIRINAWDPQTPYLKVLEYTTPGKVYSAYLQLKKEYGTVPSFYTDAADFFISKGETDTAIRILSNLAELKLEVPQLLRILGSKLMNLKKYEEAISIYEKILRLKGEEPQSYRDLGLAYEAAGYKQKAVNTLYEVIIKEWDGRFENIEIIVLNEINRILSSSPGLDHTFMDERLIKKEPVDIRVVLTWDTDNCDMDLWVTDPTGEKCFYEHKKTRNGGKISNDFTQGYGPEEYMIRNAIPGEYTVHVNYYGTDSQALLAPVNLQVTFFTNYSRANEQRRDIVLRLMNTKDVVEVGKFVF